MTAPRIDTVRNNIRATIGLLELAGRHIDDLHALAYERHRAAEQQRVRGGTIDYALDTHGDPRARAAYAHLSTTVLDIGRDTAGAIHYALQLFTDGQVNGRRDTTADATTPEIIAAMAALEQRRTRGEHTATTQTQPLPRGATRVLDVTRLQTELDALRNAVRKTGVRPDRSRLTPRELTAWQTATHTTPRKKTRR